MKLKISASFFNFLSAAIFSIALIVVAIIGYYFTKEMWINRIFILLGGDIIKGGYIQFLTYLAFFWCLMDIFEKRRFIGKEKLAFKKNILPTRETHILMPGDVLSLIKSMRNLEIDHKYLLTDLIKKACLKFRSTKSSGEMMEMVSIQVEINKEKAESEQSNIRYLTWGIPSIGFIGTVLGISQALVIANSGDMKEITTTLGVAFDTTFISLVLSIIIMWFFYNLQEQTDKLHADIKEYVMDNLVNRIEF